jgi:hypothetical protein
MMQKGAFCTGVLYNQDQWKKYWEGSLRRENGNIGSFTSTSAMWVGNYGISNKINVIGMLPYIWNKTSQGTLRPLEGVQDLTLVGKYKFFGKEFTKSKFSAFAVAGFSTPLTNYTPDFLPVSLGMKTTNLYYRLTSTYTLGSGFYGTVSGEYVWRSNTHLDRIAYETNNKYYSTNEVRMPNVIDFNINLGYKKGPLQADISYVQQNVLGGGDIRRQDMPFVSNKMNYSKVGAMVLYYLPFPKMLAVRAAGSYTVAGRNVGQTTSVSLGLLYTIRVIKPTI